MNSNRRDDDPLTRLLRQGDPATPGEELSAAEAARMRRALVTALSARERPPVLRWRLVLASFAAAAFALILVFDRPSTEKPADRDGEKAPVPVVVAEKPALPDAAVPRAVEEAAVHPRPVTHPPAVRRVASPRPTRSSPARPVQAAVRPAESTEAATRHAVRQIEFETPGGTRVIWVLDPAYQALSTEVEGR